MPLRLLAALFLLLSPLSASWAQAAPDSGRDFSLVLFPDTESYMNAGGRQTWLSQCEWVARSRDDERIAAVLHLGDVTKRGRQEEFEIASEGFGILERAGIPALPLIGNHDYARLPGVGRRGTARYDAFARSLGIEGKPWFGGSFGEGLANYFATFDFGGMRLLVLALELYPRIEAADWAAAVIDAHPDREVIVLTHAYLDCNGERLDRLGISGPRAYGYRTAAAGLSGEELWTRLISVKPNIRAVICGHWHPGQSAYRAERGVHGNLVHQLFINYQEAPHGGDGWIGLLRFSPSTGTAEFSAYSTSGLGYAPRGLLSTGRLRFRW